MSPGRASAYARAKLAHGRARLQRSESEPRGDTNSQAFASGFAARPSLPTTRTYAAAPTPTSRASTPIRDAKRIRQVSHSHRTAANPELTRRRGKRRWPIARPRYLTPVPSRPYVSVITPVRNGATDIPALLTCLERQTLDREAWEIVIADDGSTDGSTDGIETADGQVRVTAGPPTNSYAARARAVDISRGVVLAFCDADCRPEPEWLERGLAALERTDVVL